MKNDIHAKQKTSRRDRRLIILYLRRFLLICSAAIAAVAVTAGNIEKISATFAPFKDYLTGEPNLVELHITDAETGAVRPMLFEDGSNLIDITVGYNGAKIFLISSLEVRHVKGPCASVPTGKLVSQANYRFKFRAGQTHEFRFADPLVINGADQPLLRFQIELAPEGVFSSSCGRLYARLKYINPESKSIGYLWLSNEKESTLNKGWPEEE